MTFSKRQQDGCQLWVHLHYDWQFLQWALHLIYAYKTNATNWPADVTILTVSNVSKQWVILGNIAVMWFRQCMRKLPPSSLVSVSADVFPSHIRNQQYTRCETCTNNLFFLITFRQRSQRKVQATFTKITCKRLENHKLFLHFHQQLLELFVELKKWDNLTKWYSLQENFSSRKDWSSISAQQCCLWLFPSLALFLLSKLKAKKEEKRKYVRRRDFLYFT